jgi:hypothetical protein
METPLEYPLNMSTAALRAMLTVSLEEGLPLDAMAVVCLRHFGQLED